MPYKTIRSPLSADIDSSIISSTTIWLIDFNVTDKEHGNLLTRMVCHIGTINIGFGITLDPASTEIPIIIIRIKIFMLGLAQNDGRQ